eukprot:jgi/Hompol1/1001/HPOL_005486-RA
MGIRRSQGLAAAVESALAAAFAESDGRPLKLRWCDYIWLTAIITNPRITHPKVAAPLIESLFTDMSISMRHTRIYWNTLAQFYKALGDNLHRDTVMFKLLSVLKNEQLWMTQSMVHFLLKIRIRACGPRNAEAWLRRLIGTLHVELVTDPWEDVFASSRSKEKVNLRNQADVSVDTDDISDTEHTNTNVVSEHTPAKSVGKPNRALLVWTPKLYMQLVQGYSIILDTHRMHELIVEMEERGIYESEVAVIMLHTLCSLGQMDLAQQFYNDHRDARRNPCTKLFETMLWGHLVAQFRHANRASGKSRLLDVPTGKSPRSLYPALESLIVKPHDYGSSLKVGSVDLVKMTAAVSDIMHDMRRAGLSPTSASLTAYLSHFVIRDQSLKAIDLFDKMQAQGDDIELNGYTIVIKALFMQSRVDRINEVLNTMRRKRMRFDVVVYGTLIWGYLHLQLHEKAIEYFQEFASLGLPMNAHIYHLVFTAFACKGDMTSALQVWEDMILDGLRPTEIFYTTLILGHGRAGDIERAHGVLNQMLQARHVRDQSIPWPSTTSFNALMLAYVEHGAYDKITSVYETMTLQHNITPDAMTFQIILRAQNQQSTRDTTQTSLIIDTMNRRQIAPSSHIYSMLTGIYSSAGRIQDALRLQDVQKKILQIDEFGDHALNKYLMARAGMVRKFIERIATKWMTRLNTNSIIPRIPTQLTQILRHPLPKSMSNIHQ